MSRINVANFRHPDGTSDNISLTDNGRVGIGTASPSSKLHVYENSAVPARIYLENTEGRYELKADANLALHYSNQHIFNNADGTERARIDSSGNLKFNSGYGSVATAYGVRAWINFQGNAATIGTGRDSGNMDAVTDNGTGRYTLNFTNDMPDDDYAAFGNCGGTSSANGDESKITFNSGAYTTSSLGVRVVDSPVDALVVNICIIR